MRNAFVLYAVEPGTLYGRTHHSEKRHNKQSRSHENVVLNLAPYEHLKGLGFWDTLTNKSARKPAEIHSCLEGEPYTVHYYQVCHNQRSFNDDITFGICIFSTR